LRELIQSAVKIFRANPHLDADEILQLLMDTGVERNLAIQLVALLPLAYGRVLLADTGALFPGTYLCLGKGKGRLDGLPLWGEAIAFAQNDPEPFFPLASRSPEVKVADRALREGKKLDSLVWGPPAFLWPIEPVPGLGEGAKPPNWLRQIWDEPAIYSVPRRERTLARMATIIGILVALFAVGLVAYYALGLLREP
jgi:hypothetical protein